MGQLLLRDSYNDEVYGMFTFSMDESEFEDCYYDALEKAQPNIEKYGDDIQQVINELDEMKIEYSYEQIDWNDYNYVTI